MSELIADLPYRITDTNGEEFYVSVAGEPRVDGRWDGWLEYVPLDDRSSRLPKRRNRLGPGSFTGLRH